MFFFFFGILMKEKKKYKLIEKFNLHLLFLDKSSISFFNEYINREIKKKKVINKTISYLNALTLKKFY